MLENKDNKPELDFSVENNLDCIKLRSRYFKNKECSEDEFYGYSFGALICKYQINYNGLLAVNYPEINKYSIDCLNEMLCVNTHLLEFSTDEFKDLFYIGFKEYFEDYYS